MACASCEERARLLKGAREAYNRGDMDEAERTLKEVFGTIKVDISKLSAAIFNPITNLKPGERRSLLKEIQASDPRAGQERLGGSGMLPDNHEHGHTDHRDSKVS